MQRSPRLVFPILVFAAAAAAFAACGGDDDKDTDPVREVLDVRDGYWEITTQAVLTGDDPACTGSETDVDTSVVCDLDFGDTAGLPLDLTCEVDADASQFTFTCGGSSVVAPCTVFLTTSGSGTYTETTVDFTATVVVSATGPANPCAALDDPCTTEITVSGRWLSAAPEGACDGNAKPASLAAWVRRGVAGVVGSY